MKFIVVPLGSAGDVHPMVALAQILRERGHDVVMVVQAFVADIAERAGVRMVVVGNRAQQESIIKDPSLWHPRKAFSLLSRWIPVTAREMLPVLEEEIVTGDTVMIAGALAFGARILSERRDVPLITVQLQPSVFMSVEESPVMMAGAEWLERAPRWVRKAYFSLAHYHVDRQLRKPTNSLRREAGLQGRCAKGIFKTWWHSPDGVLCLFPEWWAHKALDWPQQAVLTRFMMYDEGQQRPLDPAAARFLAEGDPPIVITPGSANAQAEKFLGEAMRACERMHRRAVVVTRYPEQVPGGVNNLPGNTAFFEYLPFSQVFPHAAAVIHHGGIGTTAQCLAAGVPQLLMPMAYDQPDNAARVRRLGVGDYLYPKKFAAAAIADKLLRLIGDPVTRASCALVRQKMKCQMPPVAMTEVIEAMAERGLRVRQINGAGMAG